MASLNILHVMRTPVGGLFRHVLDLAREQVARGHRVGIVADSLTGGPQAAAALDAIAPSLALGLSRTPMRRAPGPADLPAMLHVSRRIAQCGADVVHGHGAKGGAYARFALGGRRAIRVYTPHGGSLHYDPATLGGKLFLGTEKLLMRRGDLYIFESAYSADVFRRKVGRPPGLTRIVHNGVGPGEFAPAEVAADASDLLFVGELRDLKGVDVLLAAMALLRAEGRPLTATLVGAGPDRARFEAEAARLGLAGCVSFPGPLPARQAFARGRLLVIPSRAESLPYIVLEAAAAGKPLLTTRVGGIPEIYGPLADMLVPPDDSAALAGRIAAALDRPDDAVAFAAALRTRICEQFTIATMVDGVLAAYADAHTACRRPTAAYGRLAASR